MGSNPPQAISLFADGFAIQYRQSIIDFGLRHGVPGVSGWPIFAFTYGPHLDSSYQRLAHYADRILQGARPSDPADRATDQVRAYGQSQNRQSARPNHPVGIARGRRRTDRIGIRFAAHGSTDGTFLTRQARLKMSGVERQADSTL